MTRTQQFVQGLSQGFAQRMDAHALRLPSLETGQDHMCADDDGPRREVPRFSDAIALG